jgi:pyruvate/2-oxoglutarate/acetoin dehydrogenase E1 component
MVAMREITMGDAIGEAIAEEMRRDERVYIMGTAVGPQAASVTRPLTDMYKEFGPERIRETGIIECAIAGSSVGAALAGMRPIADFSMVDFMFPALNEILGFAGMWRYEHGGADGMTIPLVFRGSIRSYGGGGAEHARAPLGIFWHAPGLKLVIPTTPYDAKGLLKTAIRDDNPVVFLEPARLYQIKGPVPEEEYLIPFGQAKIRREGVDVTIVGVGYVLTLCLQAAEDLVKEGIQAEVIDPRTLEPLDMETIVGSVRKTGRLVVVDEDHIRCGVGAEIGFQVQEKIFKSLKAPVARVGSLNRPHPVSQVLINDVLPTKEKILAAVRQTLALGGE